MNNHYNKPGLDDTLKPFTEKMIQANLPTVSIETFKVYFQQLFTGQNGLIHETDILPIEPDDICSDYHQPNYYSAGLRALPNSVIIKLNGGLGTTMGCQGPKSLLKVKSPYTFLDIILKQLSSLNNSFHTKIPLVLMNSFNTEKSTIDALQHYPGFPSIIPPSFTQHKFPKILTSSFDPVSINNNPDLEWNPPGHGDLYLSLMTSGILEKLLENNYTYAFISNSDNLGATIDLSILGFLHTSECDFFMEVTNRTEADQKGGHLAKGKKDGKFILREIGQCSGTDFPFFQDISRHQFFNTNNLWVNLNSLYKLIQKNGPILNLPLICNQKNLDPVDPESPLVYQLESAMGTILPLFSNSAVIRVPRTRFIPVKNIENLLLLQSDYYCLSEDFRIERAPSANVTPPVISLDNEHYRTVDHLAKYFPYGSPSLKYCTSLSVTGEFVFGKNIVIEGNVRLVNQSKTIFRINDNAVIKNDIIF